MSKSARMTAQTAAIAVVLATGAAGGLIAASLPSSTGDQAAAVIAPAPELNVPVAPVQPQVQPAPRAVVPVAPVQPQVQPAPQYVAPAPQRVAPHVSKSS